MKKDTSGKAFERSVAEAYQALDYQVTRNVQVAGRQTDLLAKKAIPGASTMILAIECKDHKRPVGNSLVDKFSSRIVAQCAAGVITEGVLVSRSGFTIEARAAAEKQKSVTLLSLEELTSHIFDVRYALREFVKNYEKQEIFHDYIPLKVGGLHWLTMTPSSQVEDFDRSMQSLIDFDGKIGIGALLVLADFGAGKTTLLRNIEYQRAKAHLDGDDTRVPLFVQLRDYRDSQDIGALLRASFRDAYYRDLPLELIWQRIDSGSFYLLLDGFDEMIDRSDAIRRLQLFHSLLPLFRSRSPVILTSRPSYLVERGELDNLLAELRAEEAAIPTPILGGSHNKVVIEQMRRKLFARMREGGQRADANRELSPYKVQVTRLQALDREQIEEFISRHADELHDAGSSVAAVIDFIERTYDLMDLATRPMLLRLIVSTVLIGGLDLSDTSTQYGVSGLYEMYTHAKLDFDLDKFRSRDGGLDVDARRLLAEAIALEMYRAGTLELEFHESLEQLAPEPGPLGKMLAKSRLSEAEIATDLAARSFVTLDRDGMCRFIHKSFRGFFVARILKEKLPKLDPMFNEVVEHEVLYFLGGFDPTEPDIGPALWQNFRRTNKEEVTLRRNLLLAFLYTRPNHGRRKIENVEVFEAEFGRLQFKHTCLSSVTWRDVTIAALELTKAQWSNVHLVDSRCTKVLTEEGEVSVALNGSVIESWDCDATSSVITAMESTIDVWDVKRSKIVCLGKEVLVEYLSLTNADMSCHALDDGELSLINVESTSSRLRLSGDFMPHVLRARESVITYDSEGDITGRWQLHHCVLALPMGQVEQSAWVGTKRKTGLRMDKESIILAPAGISHSLLNLPAGVFGSVCAASGKGPIGLFPKAWGVLEADDILEQIGLPKSQSGCILNHVLLVRSDWYESQINSPSAGLSAVGELEELVESGDLDFVDSTLLRRLAKVRRTTREQYNALQEQDWVKFEQIAPVPT